VSLFPFISKLSMCSFLNRWVWIFRMSLL